MSLEELEKHLDLKKKTKSYFELDGMLRAEIRPFIHQFVKLYDYADLSDFSTTHREELYGHLLNCESINMQLINELICWDEFLQGICLGYIKAEDAKSDLLERLEDIFYKPLDHWVAFEHQLEVESRARPEQVELHDLLWHEEMRARARDINNG